MPTSEYTLYKTASGVNDSDYQLVITQQQYKLKTLEFLQFGKPCKHLLIFRDRFFHRDDSLEQLCSKEKLKPTSILIIGHLKEQSFLKLFKFAGVPPKCTGKTILVFSDIFSSIFEGSKHIVLGSISEKIGIPPLYRIACAVETNERDGRITSLFLISTRDKARCKAAVPLGYITK